MTGVKETLAQAQADNSKVDDRRGDTHKAQLSTQHVVRKVVCDSVKGSTLAASLLCVACQNLLRTSGIGNSRAHTGKSR